MALARLRPADQELIRLTAWEDLDPTSVAEVLGISTKVVNVRIHRARRRLGKELDRVKSNEGWWTQDGTKGTPTGGDAGRTA